MICWMFPGQPLKRDRLIFEGPESADVSLLCRDSTGFDPVTWDDGGALASEQVRLQVFGTASSLLKARQLFREGRKPDILAEHSMGIYAALAVSGAVEERDALEMTARAGNILAAMSCYTRYAFGCVVGLTADKVEQAASAHSVHVANYNTSMHFLVAGERENIMTAMEECSASGAFSVSLFDCDAPLHTPLLEEKSVALAVLFSDYHFREPEIPLLEHVNQTLLTSSTIASFLHDELLKPVRWECSYHSLLSRGCMEFAEIGAGDSLKKFNRWTDSQG